MSFRSQIIAIAMAVLVASSVVGLSGCPSLGTVVGPGATTTNQAIEAIQKAIDALNVNSAAWQQQLNGLLNTANADVKSLINNDVTNLLQRTVASAGVEFRCDIDFIGRRVKEGLETLLARLGGRTPAHRRRPCAR